MNAKTLNQTVVEQIKKNGSQPIIDSVVSLFVQKENDRRIKALTDAVEMAAETQSKIYKCKPDVISYNEDSSVASQSYSKAKLEEKKKLSEKLDKIDKAIESATKLENPDFSPLFNLKQNESNSNPAKNTESGE